MREISAFVTDAVVAGDQSLGHCLYISGVPGTGKVCQASYCYCCYPQELFYLCDCAFQIVLMSFFQTATVLEVMQKLRKGYEEKSAHPYRFVEVNGLRLTSPEHLYTVCIACSVGGPVVGV